jgi:hypothetical protein
MKRTLLLAVVAVLAANLVTPAFSKETNPAVLQDFKRYQAKKKLQAKKKAQKIERVPMAKLRNCTIQKRWSPPKTIREVKLCEVIR